MSAKYPGPKSPVTVRGRDLLFFSDPGTQLRKTISARLGAVFIAVAASLILPLQRPNTL